MKIKIPKIIDVGSKIVIGKDSYVVKDYMRSSKSEMAEYELEKQK